MDFPTYTKALMAFASWSELGIGGWPDSRDPEFQPCLVYAGVTSQDYERAMVCVVAWQEGWGNLYRAVMSVAHVFRNRSLDLSGKWIPDSIYLNAVAPVKTFNWGQRLPDVYDTEFDKMLRHVDELYEGALLDTTNGSLYYFESPELPPPEMNLQRRAQVGTLTFYA